MGQIAEVQQCFSMVQKLSITELRGQLWKWCLTPCPSQILQPQLQHRATQPTFPDCLPQARLLWLLCFAVNDSHQSQSNQKQFQWLEVSTELMLFPKLIGRCEAIRKCGFVVQVAEPQDFVKQMAFGCGTSGGSPKRTNSQKVAVSALSPVFLRSALCFYISSGPCIILFLDYSTYTISEVTCHSFPWPPLVLHQCLESLWKS